MSLSERDRRSLAELAEELSREDPDLARALSAGPGRFAGLRRPWAWLVLTAFLAMIIGVVTLVVGIVLGLPALAALGALFLPLGAVALATAKLLRSNRALRGR